MWKYGMTGKSGSKVCNTCNKQSSTAPTTSTTPAQAFGITWIVLAQLMSFVSK
jgi:hypothetical protein